MQNDIVICQCGSTEHQIVFAHDTEDKMVYMHIHLHQWGFWERLKYGLKYIFGYKCRYGAFDEVVLNGEDHLKQFERVVETLKEQNDFVDNLKLQRVQTAAANTEAGFQTDLTKEMVETIKATMTQEEWDRLLKIALGNVIPLSKK